MLRLHSECLELQVITLLSETSGHSCVRYPESAQTMIFLMILPTSRLSTATAVPIVRTRRGLPLQLLHTAVQRHPVVRVTLH